MIVFEENKDITHLTTFNIPVKARWYVEYSSVRELIQISRDERFLNGPVYFLGGGSNLLFLRDFDGLVLRSVIKGIVSYDKDDNTCYVIAGAGEKWNGLVEWTVSRGIAGLENMAAIPGDVGASPVQNVGAYGVEAKDVVFAVECFDTLTRNTVRLSAEECRFGYRDSMFKHEGKGRYIVLRVSFKLSRSNVASTLGYGPLKDFSERIGHTLSIREVADEIKKIRDSKLPDPDKIGSAGSFFKNPVVHNGFLKEIEVLTGNRISGHPVGDDHTKVSAAWLIDQAGMKGARYGGAEVYGKQPLVIVNNGKASADDVRQLAEKVRDEVRNKFLIDLHPEVNYVDTAVKVTLLGTGTSKGIPEIGCSCRVCKSPYVKDKRTRTSAFIRTMGLDILIDPSPDFRQQALREGIHNIDAVLITHGHNDHVGGLDDLRPFCADRRLTVYTDEITDKELRTHFEYCFRKNPYPGVPTFDIKLVDNQPFYINGVKIIPIEVLHGSRPILGYRIGNFAYITDAKTIAPDQLEKIEGIHTLVINALRDRDHFSHFTLQEALNVIKEINPRQAYLTHFNHEIGRHHELARRLPENVAPGYDGLSFIVK